MGCNELAWDLVVLLVGAEVEDGLVELVVLELRMHEELQPSPHRSRLNRHQSGKMVSHVRVSVRLVIAAQGQYVDSPTAGNRMCKSSIVGPDEFAGNVVSAMM